MFQAFQGHYSVAFIRRWLPCVKHPFQSFSRGVFQTKVHVLSLMSSNWPYFWQFWPDWRVCVSLSIVVWHLPTKVKVQRGVSPITAATTTSWNRRCNDRSHSACLWFRNHGVLIGKNLVDFQSAFIVSRSSGCRLLSRHAGKRTKMYITLQLVEVLK